MIEIENRKQSYHMSHLDSGSYNSVDWKKNLKSTTPNICWPGPAAPKDLLFQMNQVHVLTVLQQKNEIGFDRDIDHAISPIDCSYRHTLYTTRKQKSSACILTMATCI